MSTIGFGDYVVSKYDIQGSHNNKENSLAKSIGIFIFMVFGLGTVASVIDAVTEVFEKNPYVNRVLIVCFGVGKHERRRPRAESRTIGLRDTIQQLHKYTTRKISREEKVLNKGVSAQLLMKYCEKKDALVSGTGENQENH